MNSLETANTTEQLNVRWFRHSAPYINAHRNKTFVIMFGGEAVCHDNFQHIIHDIALLNSLGIRLVWFTVPVRRLTRIWNNFS